MQRKSRRRGISASTQVLFQVIYLLRTLASSRKEQDYVLLCEMLHGLVRWHTDSIPIGIWHIQNICTRMLVQYKKNILPLSLYCCILFGFSSDCEVVNTSFSATEQLVYKIYYNLGFIWLETGQVVFTVTKEDNKGMPCYKLSGIGTTYPSYDWIYKVRDRFESWVDTTSLTPFHYVRDINEGGRAYYNECFFNFKKQKAYCVTSEQKKPPHLDTIPLASCSFDPITMIYYSRNIDFSKCKVRDTVPISLFLDNKVYSLYARYLGKDVLKLADKHVYRCIKFSPLLIEGAIFKKGEGMVVWATDDKNKIPLYVEAPITAGSIKAKIVSWKNLRNKLY